MVSSKYLSTWWGYFTWTSFELRIWFLTSCLIALSSVWGMRYEIFDSPRSVKIIFQRRQVEKILAPRRKEVLINETTFFNSFKIVFWFRKYFSASNKFGYYIMIMMDHINRILLKNDFESSVYKPWGNEWTFKAMIEMSKDA